MSIWRRLRKKLFCKAVNWAPKSWSGARGVRLLGHRNYVGGQWLWDQVGKLQLDFLVERGLRPSHCLLDVGCGCLRAGRFFIKYLDAGNYLGLEKQEELVATGLAEELERSIQEEKRPEFVISPCFEFHRFSKQPHFSIAQSIFTHFSPEDIRLCLRKLREFVSSGHMLYATFFEGASTANSKQSHDIWVFHYSRAQMEEFGKQTGWKPEYIGDWNHPRSQMMMRYEVV